MWHWDLKKKKKKLQLNVFWQFFRETPSIICLSDSVSVAGVLPAAIHQLDYSNWSWSFEVKKSELSLQDILGWRFEK